jgi:TPR repeat protein
MNIEEIIKSAQKEWLDNHDGIKAEALLIQATNLGSGHAAHELGVLYGTGCNNLQPNKEKSLYWLNKSLESGFEKSIASDPKWFKNNAN